MSDDVMTDKRKIYLAEIEAKFEKYVNADGEFMPLDLIYRAIGLNSGYTLELPHPAHPKTERAKALRDFLNHHYPPQNLKDVDSENADIGAAFMGQYAAAMETETLKGYGPSQCPTELIFDLLNMLEEARGETS